MVRKRPKVPPSCGGQVEISVHTCGGTQRSLLFGSEVSQRSDHGVGEMTLQAATGPGTQAKD